MLRLILSNLWNRRGRYAWLFIELIVVTALAWYILDPAVVAVADRNLPLGYDADRLVVLNVASFPETSPRFSSADTSQTAVDDNFRRLMGKIKAYDGVERITVNYPNSTFNQRSISLDQMRNGTPADSARKLVNVLGFVPGYEYLETLGVQSVPGSPSVEELSARHYSNNEIVITDAFADIYWPGENAVGKKFIQRHDNDTTYCTVVGVIKGVRYQSFNRSYAAVFKFGERPFPDKNFDIVVRLRPGVNSEKWADDFRPETVRNTTTGNFYIPKVEPFERIIASTEYSFGISTRNTQAFILSAFFLMNLILGVTGSFYLQTRRRIAEMGIHRSFGARRHNIIGILMGEGMVLTLISFLVGDLLYLQYALKVGLDTGFTNNGIYYIVDNWVTNFGEHFAIVSAIVLAVLLVCVAVGVLLPSLKISKISPVDALRDE